MRRYLKESWVGLTHYCLIGSQGFRQDRRRHCGVCVHQDLWSLLSLWKNFIQATILTTFWHCWASLDCVNKYNWTSDNHSWTSFVISYECTCSDSKKEYTLTWFQLFYIVAACNVNTSQTLLLKNRLLPNRLLARIWKVESTMCFRAYSNEYFRRQHEK